jgi:hypothetical protein
MRTVLSQDVRVRYGQLYVASGPQMPSPEECFGGQRNGLCGAAARGFLFLITGLQAGEVGFAVELGDQAPLVDERWQEIVEVSFQPAGEVWLAGWAGEWSRPLDIAPVATGSVIPQPGWMRGMPWTPGWTMTQRPTATCCSCGQRRHSRTR